MKDKARANLVRLAEAWAKGKTPEEQEALLLAELQKIESESSRPQQMQPVGGGTVESITADLNNDENLLQLLTSVKNYPISHETHPQAAQSRDTQAPPSSSTNKPPQTQTAKSPTSVKRLLDTTPTD